jgi:hypothetical protein
MATGPRTKSPQNIALGLMDIRLGNSAANIGTVTPVLTASNSLGALADASYTFSKEFYQHRSAFPAVLDLVIPTSGDEMITCSVEELSPYALAVSQGIDPSAAGSTWVGTSYTVVSSALGTYNTADDIDGGADAEYDTYRVVFLTATTYSVYSDSRGKLTGDQLGEGDTTVLSTFTDGTTELLAIPSGFFTGTWGADDLFTFSMSKEGYDSATTGEISLGTLQSPDYLRVEGVYTFPDASFEMVVIFPRAQAMTDNGELAFANDAPATISMTFTATPADSTIVGGHASWDSAPLGRIVFQTT